MPLPAAKVKIDVLKIAGLPAVSLNPGDTRYARLFVQVGSGPLRAVTGRTKPIPAAGGDFDLSSEAVAWHVELNVMAGEAITLATVIWEDHGDDAPPMPTRIEAVVRDPWRDGTLTFGAGPTVQIKVDTERARALGGGSAARARAPGNVSGSLVAPRAYMVEFVDILGLYKIDPAATLPAQASKHVVGYLSEDDLGRVFTNRYPDGTWAKDQQYIDVFVKVTAHGGQVLPVDAKVKWTILDVDDPTNDAPDFHRDWGWYVDANDYDPGTKKSIGAHPGDNAAAYADGNADESKLFGASASSSPTARWAQFLGSPALNAKSRTEAETDVVVATSYAGTSAVRIHCPNVLGTNFTIKAEVIGVVSHPEIHKFDATTGVITMWSRIDVEVVKMGGAHSVKGALPNIPQFFLPACVQLDFQDERTVADPPGTRPGTEKLDKPEIATSAEDSVFDPATTQWVDNSEVFKKKNTGGWFFLGAARLPNPLPPGGTPVVPLYAGSDYKLGATGGFAWVQVPTAAASGNYLEIAWTDAAGQQQTVGFGVNRRAGPRVAAGTPSGKVRLVLFPNDVAPDFTAGHDAQCGSLNHAYESWTFYYPQHQSTQAAPALLPGGFGVPDSGAKVTVYPPGAVATSGVSPTVKVAGIADDEFFAGRTILFTRHGHFSRGPNRDPRPNFDALVLQTVAHEFLHAFGMPHKCGHYDWRTKREHSCCMNYFDTWLIDSAHKLVSGTAGKEGNDMCGRHLMEVRRVHLEQNKGLKW